MQATPDILSASRSKPGEVRVWAGESIPASDFARVRRRTLLEGCKWDPQVGDVGTLADFPLLLPAREWRKLADWAEQLTAEMFEAELEILARPELLESLGLPGAIRRVLGDSQPLTPAAARVVRFDFHPTTTGWRISEANSDVPGGFSEGSFFSRLMAECCPRATIAGDPAALWADAIVRGIDAGGIVAMLSSPGYMEDQQIMAFLARVLHERGLRGVLASPDQLGWRDGFAELDTLPYRGPVSAVVRFVQGELLPRQSRRRDWRRYFRGGRTPVANSGVSLVTESKRFPVVWDQLGTSMRAWRELLPETRDPREVPWSERAEWVLKSAFCNTGDTVWMMDLADRTRRESLERAVRRHPQDWIAQRRFVPRWTPTSLGLSQVCVGVYTINGRAAGAYGRLRSGPVIDYQSTDIAVLISSDD